MNEDPAQVAYDAVIIGTGVGGLVAGARLVLRGYRPLLLEAADRLGGRFSTIEIDGYRVPTGAIAIETAGPFFETFGELAIDPGLVQPATPVLFNIKGHKLKPGAPVWDHMIKRVTKTAGRVAEGISSGRDADIEDDVSLEQWARRYTRSRTLLSMFQSLSAAIFTVNADELPARAFFRHLRETGAYKRFGYAPDGNVEIARSIAGAIEQRGGETRTGWRATSIELGADGLATAVIAIDPEGREQRLPARAVISNAGPYNTARLLQGTSAEQAFAERTAGLQSTSIMALAFSTEHEELGHDGIMNFTDTRRLCSIANLATACPRLAPHGRTLYEAYGCPRPAVGGGHEVQSERALLEQDLADVFPNYDRANVVLFKNLEGHDAPAQQVRPGYDLDVRTPVRNIVEVGDGVKPYGWIGTTACAQTARSAVDLLFREPSWAGAMSAV